MFGIGFLCCWLSDLCLALGFFVCWLSVLCWALGLFVCWLGDLCWALGLSVCWLGYLCWEMVVLFRTSTADKLFLEYLVVMKRTGYCSSSYILPSCQATAPSLLK